jgi:SSS family transporter
MSVATHFTGLDWGVIAGYLLLTSWIGHALRGKQATIRDFFLGGRRLPWPAVTGSIIATEISALTFVGVPGMVFAAKGDFTYLQWALGSVIARFIVAIWFVRVFYQREIFSPYDYIGHRLGDGAKRLTTLLFFLGSILGQSVRLLVTALVLRTCTGIDFHLCIWIIGGFAVLWTLMGGMTTVIWTDVVQFGVFVLGGVLALLWIVGSLDGGWAALISQAGEAGKLRILNLSTDPAVEFTLWVGLLAMPFQNMAAFGTDQLNAQRIFCCRNASDASKAMIASCVSQLITILMLFVGAGLFVYYLHHPPGPGEQALFKESPDYVFPVWITTVLPPGLSGLILAAAFAAAISSLDSILAALSQTFISLFHTPEQLESMDQKKLVFRSRVAVCVWGIILCAFAVALDHLRGNINMVNLAFGMVSYTYGPLLGMFLLALSPLKRDARGLWIGLGLSLLLALWIRPDLYTILKNFGVITAEQAIAWKPAISYAWLFPSTCLLTLGCGVLFGRPKPTST